MVNINIDNIYLLVVVSCLYTTTYISKVVCARNPTLDLKVEKYVKSFCP